MTRLHKSNLYVKPFTSEYFVHSDFWIEYVCRR